MDKHKIFSKRINLIGLLYTYRVLYECIGMILLEKFLEYVSPLMYLTNSSTTCPSFAHDLQENGIKSQYMQFNEIL
jgi:hypothetical protein